jgi:phosphoglycerate kinase
VKILDIGSITLDEFSQVIFKQSATIIWNGPLGYFEDEQFRAGSIEIANMLSQCNAKVIIGGGDTIAVLNTAKIPFEKFFHVSTGGGAMLEYLSGNELPGIKALDE